MSGPFTSGKRTNIVQETKQIQAALIGVFAALQYRSEQIIDTFGQRTAMPRTVQEVAECCQADQSWVSLPQPTKGGDRATPVTSLQRGESVGQNRLITEQARGPILEISCQLLINATRPTLQLLAQALQLLDPSLTSRN